MPFMPYDLTHHRWSDISNKPDDVFRAFIEGRLFQWATVFNQIHTTPEIY